MTLVRLYKSRRGVLIYLDSPNHENSKKFMIRKRKENTKDCYSKNNTIQDVTNYQNLTILLIPNPVP